MSAKTVFISYSHDSDDHRGRVLALSERLRDDGIETLLDRYVNGSPQQGWPRWMLDQLDAANSVLVVCTETYYRRFRGHEDPDKGKGVDWEGALITQEIYDSRSTTLKFIPVLFSAEDEKFIPEPLRSGTHYTLTSASSYDSLYDFLLGQAGVEPGDVGQLKARARRKGSPLTFGEEPATHPTQADISRIIKYAPSELIGREDETKLLSDAWDQAVRGETKRPHILTFVALGGEGKTSLVAKWAADLAYRNWPGCDGVFAWSFYSQGTREQMAASSDLFLAAALEFFGDAGKTPVTASSHDKGRRLADLVGERRALLVLDGLEPLQYAPTSPTPGELKDQGLAALVKGLAANSHGLCAITTRYSIPDLRAYWQTTAPEHELKSLSVDAGVDLLKRLGVKGTQKEFEELVEDVDGHALTLNLLGGFLKRAFKGDIRQRDRVKFEKANEKIQGGHAFRAMAAYEEWLMEGGDEGRREVAILRLLGLFDRPADAGCIEALRGESIPDLTEPIVGLEEDDWEFSVTGLDDAKLLTVNRDASGTLVSLDAHPLLREYFARQLRTQHPEAWRAAHRRLYEHLCATTKEGDEPTLEDLQPLYQAVAHGCQAGLQQDACDKVYDARILRGNKSYSAKKLGALGSDLGAVASFFDQPWGGISRALTEARQAWLLNNAAFYLRALGRLIEALEPMRAALEMRIKQQVWESAAIVAGNLSGLELTLGDVSGAVGDAEQSVTYADSGDVAFWKIVSRTTHADAVHQTGLMAKAEKGFREAEEMQAKSQPEYGLLYSIRGFQYCDLLLSEAERAAWQTLLECGKRQPNAASASTKPGHDPTKAPSPLRPAGAIQSCVAVSQRAAQALKWVTGQLGLLDEALDHLTLGRAAFYKAILEGSALEPCNASLKLAMDGLRRAGTTQHIAQGLLTRAWLRSLESDAEGSQADLDDAWEIAERGPMRLHMADIHLYRARLFHGVKPYPWESPQEDLAAARKLIESCGYWRRKEELEDAEAAAKNWK
jgi:tetratricopeptide (TPR) repeat protein